MNSRFLFALTLALSAMTGLKTDLLAQEDKKPVTVRPLNRKLPFEVLPSPANVEAYKDKLGGKATAIWVEGDVLTILHKHSGDHVQLTGGIQQPMNRLAGTDLWILKLKMDGWEKAFFTYFFIGSEFVPGTRLTVTPLTWYGSQAPAKPESTQTLKGSIVKRTIHSQSLNEDRELEIYLPPNAPDHDLPAFFMADGQGCKEYAKVVYSCRPQQMKKIVRS